MIHGMALCSGIGAMDLGLRLALGTGYRSVVHVERDAYAAAVLVARMEEQILDPAPIWDDVGTFDGHPWRGLVDIVTAGFPCQPFSRSGLRQGLADVRWIWKDIARVLGEVRPNFIFIENVPELSQHGLPRVLGDLSELGFDAEWDCFSAKDVEAPHTRERLWILAAHAASLGRGNGSGESGDQAVSVGERGTTAHRCAGDTAGARREGEGVRGFEPGQPGWWAPAPGVPLLAHGAATNVDRLRCSGNAVVPAVVALAFTELYSRLVGS